MTINPTRSSLSLPSAVETRRKGWDGAVRQGFDQGEREGEGRMLWTGGGGVGEGSERGEC